jgi:hypothetical protein
MCLLKQTHAQQQQHNNSKGRADESSPVVEFQVVVREIREKVLPDPNDAWASDATENEKKK